MMLNPHSNLLLRALHADPPAAASALVALGVRPEITLAVTPRDDGLQASGTVTPAKRHVVLEARRASATRRVVAHRTVAAEEGAFEAGLRLAPGRYWVTARTLGDAANVAGSSPLVAAHI